MKFREAMSVLDVEMVIWRGPPKHECTLFGDVFGIILTCVGRKESVVFKLSL